MFSEKTKSERINALRKQYDAFLDEDKKRKDRNTFILGRLENMRFCTPAVSPVRQNLANIQINKYPFITQERPDYLRKIRFDDSTIVHSRPPGFAPDCVLPDEQRILQEISKKYILIPKLQPTRENTVTCYNPSNLSNDADWRNKYNILDELKKFEKEGSSEVSKDTDDIPCDTINKVNSNDIQTIKAVPENPGDPNLVGSPNLISQTVDTKIGLTNDPINRNIDYKIISENKQIPTHDIIKNTGFENEVISPELNPMNEQKKYSDSNKINEQYYPNENLINDQAKNKYENTENINYNQAQDLQQKEIKVKDHIVPSSISQINNKTLAQNNTVELSNTNIVHSNITEPLIQKEYIDPRSESVKIIAQPSEIIETIDSNASIRQNEPVLEIRQQVYESNNEVTVVSDDAIPSQINEFETEQKEMFYSEETGYNQNVDTVGYSTQNEEYTNEQYSYYNETQQEQPYYPEISEHEESTERYDPNYEQQYVENYDQNVNITTYGNQPYVGDNYGNQQEVTNVNYEQQPAQQEVLYEQQPGQQELTNVNYEQQPAQQELLYEQHPGQQEININYEQQPVQQEILYEQQPGQQEITNVNYDQQSAQQEGLYEQQPGQQEITNVNYQEQPVQQEILTDVDYEQQPFTYEYEQHPTGNIDQTQLENVNTYDAQASEVVDYETQQYNEVGEVSQVPIPDQNVYESQQDYVQMQQEPVQNTEQFDGQGYVETQNAYQSENVAAVQNTTVIEPKKMT